MRNHFFSEHTIPKEGPERGGSLDQLKDTLSQVTAHQFAEVWLNHNRFPALCALVNGDRGWLMLLRYEGDAGYSSRGDDDFARLGNELEFCLSNGHLGTHPIAWTLPTREVLNALQCFANSGCVPESIRWHNDSADGSSGPNDPDFPR